ncbi:MAG: type 4a pilus biogenesis protein PilO [Gammaproteobacteria bacterium]|nr:type 4a pilus biogenesis protein PilO [Gammaproteobacteria bacterium]
MEIKLLTELQELDSENPSSWPNSVKMFFIVMVAIFTLGLGYYLFVNDELSTLERETAKEQTLRKTYRLKHSLAANLGDYRAQMEILEIQLATMLKKLPAGHETPGLLDDITFVATHSGLKIVSITWGDEQEKEFYTELPLDIDVEGRYHEFGRFVSEIANLPRIVSLHDFDITAIEKSKELKLKIVAKTYRYKEMEAEK